MDDGPVGQVSVRFVGEDGNELGGAGILLPTSVTCNQLQILCNQLLESRGLASGSGDTTVRIWDIDTELPLFTCKGHKNWVLCIAWSPDAKKIASACKNGQIMIWDSATGAQTGKTLSRHKQWITYLAWQPMHRDPKCRLLASAGKDGNIHIWDTVQGTVVRSLS
ncbi:NLE domain protein, partial [Ancylostoma duodenale]